MRYVINGVDIETTGLRAEDGHRIIELAIPRYETTDGENFTKVGRTFVIRLDPKRSIDEKAQAVHGIDASELVGCPTWEEKASEIATRLFDCNLLVAHNAEFDLNFLITEFLRVGITPRNVEIFCTMLNGRAATAMGKVPNLGELCYATGVDYDAKAAHAADYDIEKTMEAYIAGLRLGLYEPPKSLLDGLLEAVA
jgi:DNA polymerase-3 subunit epsilon